VLPELGDRSTLPDYLAYAALNNGGLEAAFNEWKAAIERIPQMRALPDPQFTYRYFISEIESQDPQVQGLNLAQAFPWFGKLELQGDIAAEQARAARARYEAAKLKLFYQVKSAYAEYYYLGRAIDVVAKTRGLIVYLEQVAQTRYAAGSAAHADVIRAQVELATLDDRLTALRTLRPAVMARLNAAMNRPVEAILPWPAELPQDPLEESDEAVLSQARRRNPDLAALDHDIARWRHAVALARLAYYPDVTLGFDYTDVRAARRAPGQGLNSTEAQRSLIQLSQGRGDLLDVFNIPRSFAPDPRPPDSGRDVWMVYMSINVPVWYDKYRAGEREAENLYYAAIARKRDRESELDAEIRWVLYHVRDAERRISLYRDTLLPKAEESLSATQTAYQGAKAAFSDLLDAERVLLEFELARYRASADRAQRRAELDMLAGSAVWPEPPAGATPAPTGSPATGN